MRPIEKAIQKNISLAPYTTIRIGGPAAFFVKTQSTEELVLALEWAKSRSFPIAILGGGSNLLVSDHGFSGLVIKPEHQKIRVSEKKIECESGALLAGLSTLAQAHSLSGLECGIGIPGTLGGAIYGNSSNFLGSVADHLTSVWVIDPQTGQKKEYAQEECKFSYRDSRFKSSREMILSANFLLNTKSAQLIKHSMNRLLVYKKQTQSTPYPTSGCMFKNHKILTDEDRKIAERAKVDNLIKYSEDMGCSMLPFRSLIEAAGLKGRRIGGLMISDVNANFMLNVDRAKALDVLGMIDLIRRTIRQKFQITLELEIQQLGFND